MLTSSETRIVSCEQWINKSNRFKSLDLEDITVPCSIYTAVDKNSKPENMERIPDADSHGDDDIGNKPLQFNLPLFASEF